MNVRKVQGNRKASAIKRGYDGPLTRADLKSVKIKSAAEMKGTTRLQTGLCGGGR